MELDEFVRNNIARALQAVDAADVLAVGFVLFSERLLVDMRTTDQDPPMIKVVQPLGSVEERIRELRKTRPRFPRPQSFLFFMWPKSIRTLEEQGVWQRIVQRCLTPGHQEVAEECDRALEGLRQLERAEYQEAIGGAKYRTLWTRSR